MNKSTEWLDALEDLIGFGDKLLNAYDASDGTPLLAEEEMREAHKGFHEALNAFQKAEKRQGK
jgi:hypothetical protein